MIVRSSSTGRAVWNGYPSTVSLDPDAENRRIHEKYAPARARDLLVTALIAAAIFVASFFWNVDWWVVVGAVAALIGWEATKFRLRRNASSFAKRSE